WLWRAATPTSSTSPRRSRAATDSSVARAVPPGTRCQHCSSVTATRNRRPTACESRTTQQPRRARPAGSDGSVGWRAMADPSSFDLAFWTPRRVLVTGASGFLGKAVVERLRSRQPAAILTPPSSDYDLRRPEQVAAMYEQLQPDVVIHLAARVGGIGYNRERPADLYLDNLLMGTYVLDEARRREVAKTVMVGTICS